MLEYRTRLESTKRGCVCSWECSQGRGEKDGTFRVFNIWPQKWAATHRSERAISKNNFRWSRVQQLPEKEQLCSETQKFGGEIKCRYWPFLLQGQGVRTRRLWQKGKVCKCNEILVHSSFKFELASGLSGSSPSPSRLQPFHSENPLYLQAHVLLPQGPPPWTIFYP